MSPQHSNGHSTVPFHAPGAVPIIGQPFELSACLVTALLTCKCTGLHPLLITTNAVTACPACKRGYIIQGVQIVPDQPPSFKIGIVTPPDEPAKEI